MQIFKNKNMQSVWLVITSSLSLHPLFETNGLQHLPTGFTNLYESKKSPKKFWCELQDEHIFAVRLKKSTVLCRLLRTSKLKKKTSENFGGE